MADTLIDKVASYEQGMIETMSKMISIESISPMSGGKGESERAAYLESVLRSWGFEPKRYVYKDGSGTDRPSLVVRFGKQQKTLWIVSHIDTVAVGERTLWNTDPFKATIKDGRLYGRGSSDDGQAAIASMYALKALKELGIDPKYNFGLVLVADEELGSEFGIQKLLGENIFSKDDLYLVPDAGWPEGDKIEIAEKSIMWLKITVMGKQVHASTPDEGVNAYRHMIRFLDKVDRFLHQKYNASDPLFKLPSTFEMTKHEKNVDSINIIPGNEVAYIDCRVLPQYRLDEVFEDVKRISNDKEFAPAKFSFEFVQREDAAPPTSADSEIVKLLKSTIKAQRGIETREVGIGGGTCAAYFRRKGLPAVVWETIDDVAHQPNEYCVIKYMVDDSKVFAGLFV